MRHRLARHPEPVGELVLSDALAGLQRAVGDRLQDPRIDLVDQVRKRVERDHAGSSATMRGNTEFRIRRYGGRIRASSATKAASGPVFALHQVIDIARVGYCAWGCFRGKRV